MKLKQFTVLLIALLVLPLFLNGTQTIQAATTQSSPNLYFGVDVAFERLAATEQLIDNVSSYTNFFVIGCTGNYNLTRLTVISQYVYNKGLTFIVYSDDPRYPSSQWLQEAKGNWGDSFLGIYYLDEEGGKQLDQAKYPIVTTATNYSEAAESYVNIMNRLLRNGSFAIAQRFAYPTEYQLFTSDYGLYWYDYQAGYNTVFTEFGWETGWTNDSQQLNVALCRGAATAFNEDWGVMITLTQNQQIEPGPALYSDMLVAYENGAKYIIVFDSNANFTQNVLQQGQLDAMKQFWQYVQANPRTITPVSDRTAYVLPENYGYGFRGPDDKLWGLWNTDSLTIDIGMSAATLLQMDGNNLDIVYPSQALEYAGYNSIIYWNDTALIPTSSLNPQQTAPSPFYANSVYFYAAAASIIVAVAIAATVLKFRKKSS
ncbi:MAG: hypothetical protein ABSE15_00145 [Candidatus Bathyarchaeia archaeon]|jgi:hypothetical protein